MIGVLPKAEKKKNPAHKSETCFGRCAKSTFVCSATAALKKKRKKEKKHRLLGVSDIPCSGWQNADQLQCAKIEIYTILLPLDK